MNNIPFRVLYREFLFRVVDLELLSQQGDITKLLGQFAGILIFVSLWQAVAALLIASGASTSEFAVVLAWGAEHALISITVLVVGLFAVLSWDSAFPDRRDVLILSPLPISARVLFLSKVAAVGTALGVTLLALNLFSGLAAPFLFVTSPTISQPRFESALPAIDAANMKSVLDRDLGPSLQRGGVLGPGTKAGLAIGILKHDDQRVIVYGTAASQSIFQIASVTKTFTGLMLAQMVAEGKVAVDTPVRELLPPGVAQKPKGEEITLLDLATHHSGLQGMPDIRGGSPPNYAQDFGIADLYAFLAQHGVAKARDSAYSYSNLGFGLLGSALAEHSGLTYSKLLNDKITGPLAMSDTAFLVTPEQRDRILPAFDAQGRLVRPWSWDALAGAGTLLSTAPDMLTFLRAQLHPERFASLAPALVESHRIHAKAEPGYEIALAWMFDPETGTYWHDGRLSGYTSYVFFNPAGDYAGVVLLNRADTNFAGLLGQRLQQRLAGAPPISLDGPITAARTDLVKVLRGFAAYWIAIIGAGVFTFCSVLTAQGLAQLLPRQVFLRVSSFLQMAFFVALLVVYFLQPAAAGANAITNDQGVLFALPTYWFFGLAQQLMGPTIPQLELLARRAWIGLGFAFVGAGASYLICYFRTLRKIAEQPDILPSRSFSQWLPSFGSPLETAISQFGLRTLLRSRQHRVILSFYLGIAVGLTIFLSNAPVLRSLRTTANIWYLVNAPILISTVLMIAASVVGARIVFSLPLALRANWIFRVMPLPGVRECLGATRRALYVIGVIPIWTALAAALLWLWPWRDALEHLLILALLAGIAAELCLNGMYKLPFTCSYLPGKTYLNMVVLTVMGSVVFGVQAAVVERDALRRLPLYISIVGGLVTVLAMLRWRTTRNAASALAALHFEETMEPTVLGLGLHHDGVVVIDGAI